LHFCEKGRAKKKYFSSVKLLTKPENHILSCLIYRKIPIFKIGEKNVVAGNFVFLK